jgi:hypothetical protein
LRFILKLAVIAILETFAVQAHHFATAGHNVNTIALNGRRAEEAEVFPVVDLA